MIGKAGNENDNLMIRSRAQPQLENIQKNVSTIELTDNETGEMTTDETESRLLKILDELWFHAHGSVGVEPGCESRLNDGEILEGFARGASRVPGAVAGVVDRALDIGDEGLPLFF